MTFEQYYPTPFEVAKKVAKLIKVPVTPILEPSAGNGALAEGFIKAFGNRWNESRYSAEDFHCVEINANRAATLKGKDFKVIWDDFETFNPVTPYSTIIMNPPFHSGAKHFLKALKILADGGEIACILNAETIKNPFSNERKDLIRRLEEQESYTVEYFQSAFDDTDVEIAIVYARKKPAKTNCITFENFKKSIVEERQSAEDYSMTRYGEINALIDTYRAEVQTALRLYDEILNYNHFVKNSIGDDYHNIFEIKIHRNERGGRIGIVKAINYNYWYRLLYSDDLSSLLTSDSRQAYHHKLAEMADYEFNERNILQLKEDLCKNLFENIDSAIMKVWRQFTCEYAYTDYGKNIHYYNGWTTNKAYRCNKKVIIPLSAFSSWSGSYESYRVKGSLSDIEKAMNYLDSGRTEDSGMANKLEVAQARGITANIDTKYFTVNLYKKGTAHLTFKDLDLLKKFNLYCGKKLNWLPDNYGTKSYKDLTAKEKEVADSFEGRESYEDTFKNQQFYLPQDVASSMLMLTSG